MPRTSLLCSVMDGKENAMVKPQSCIKVTKRSLKNVLGAPCCVVAVLSGLRNDLTSFKGKHAVSFPPAPLLSSQTKAVSA